MKTLPAVTPPPIVPQTPTQYQPFASAMTALPLTTPPPPLAVTLAPELRSTMMPNEFVPPMSVMRKFNPGYPLFLKNPESARNSFAVTVIGWLSRWPLVLVASGTTFDAVVVPSGAAAALFMTVAVAMTQGVVFHACDWRHRLVTV